MRLLVFWDSIWEWFYDYDKWGWVNRLKLKLWEEIEVFNCSISAYTTKNVLKIFDSFFNAVSAREKWKEKETIIVFAIWTNDSLIENWKFFVNENDFKDNLIKLINLCKDNKLVKKVFFLTTTNCDESLTNPTKWWEYYYTNNNLQKYNDIIKKVALENKIEVVDIFWILEKSDIYDWLHPNVNWHKKIFEKVYNFLENKI